ncbi:thioredoxin family protein [Streptomyces sp. NPDC004126]|uniref:thioredoxin family protein n=1 Tax=Streptomyces sp. NPDC004126 TaxID=3390695 RepID=UPI003D085266
MLRSVRSGHRTTSSAPPLARRLPLVAAAVVAAGLATACGPSPAPAGSAARAGAVTPAPALPTDGTAPGASPEVSATASALPSAPASASASAPASGSAAGSSPGTARSGGGSAAGSGAGSGPGSGGAKPTSAAPAPAPARVPGPGYDGSADAQALIDAALRAAKSDGRMVLLDFGANWCGNCKAADKVFAQPATTALLADDYHLVKVDIGGNSSANSALLRKYSPSGGTYTMPVLVVVSPSGTTRVDTHATGNPPLTADGINTFLRKWAP